MEGLIVVDIADYKIGKGMNQLVTRNLGSCVGIALRDPHTGIGGLLHIMLPECNRADEAGRNAPKYADKGIDAMVQELITSGAMKSRLVAKIAGGAHIVKTENVPESEDISSRNVTAVRKKLAELGIPVIAQDIGEYHPRTVYFEPGTGKLLIKTIGKKDKII